MANRNDQLATERLHLNHAIRQKEAELRVALRRQRLGTFCIVAAPILALIIYVVTWATWRRIDIAPFDAPAGIALVALTASAIVLRVLPGGPMVNSGAYRVRDRRDSRSKIELDLSLLRDQKRVLALRGDLDLAARRAVYRDDAFAEIDQLRQDSKYYRRVNNGLQAVLIIGSLATTGASSISIFASSTRWATVAVSFSVGMASGFLGYFKYRERGFYLQQTADSIEEEWEAFELGIGRYKRAQSEELALADFVEEIHRLKNEQRKREQHLDQPPEQKSSSGDGR